MTMGHSHECIISNYEPTPFEPLLVLNGALNNVPLRVLKDDGWYTNTLSTTLVKQSLQHFNLVKRKSIKQHSKKDLVETSSNIILNVALKIGSHTYATNWVVSDFRYGVLLGMPWHVK